MRHFLTAIIFAGSLTAVGCSETNKETATVDTATVADPTWYGDIQPIIGAHCQGCHSDTDNFTFALTDYESVSGLAPILLEKMEGSTEPPYLMPPFGHRESDECEELGDWRDDSRLSEEQLTVFGEWIDAGTPEGDPNDTVDYDIPSPLTLQGDGITRYSTSGITIPAGEFDDKFLCFSVDPELSEDGWFDGIEIHAGNAEVVHHVVVFVDPEGESEALGGDDGMYPCFGGSKVSSGAVAYAWAPGSQPLTLMEDSGSYLQAGGRLVVQIHYHPNGREEVDQTDISVRWLDVTPSKLAAMFVYGGVDASQVDSDHWVDTPFMIPAGATNHTEAWEETLYIPIQYKVRLWGIFPHMHLTGTEIKVTINRADGTELCLSHIPAWDFGWQRSYLLDGTYDEMPELFDGDVLTVSCTYNNSDSNATLMEYSDGESIADISVGEESVDEMCTAILGVVVEL